MRSRPIFNGVKLRDLYTDWRLAAGIVLIVTGAANWGAGFVGTEQYRQPPSVASDTQNEDVFGGFEGLDDISNRAVLTPLTDRQRRASINSAQMDFFHAMFVVGEVIFVAGVVFTLAALLAALRREAKSAMSRTLRGYLPAVSTFYQDPNQDRRPGSERS
jgi:hypothetical protein